MTTDEKIKVMQAFVEGKDIEYITIGSPCDYWTTIVNPTWNWAKFEYRVKRRPTRLDIVNQFMKSRFGIDGAFEGDECPCPGVNCDHCTIGDSVCPSKKRYDWWHFPMDDIKE